MCKMCKNIKNYILREGEEMEWMRVNRYTDTTATIIRPHRFNIFFLTRTSLIPITNLDSPI